MTFLQLEYFQKIVDAGTMTAAAEQLHITQPALSKSISMLEEELGVKLFAKNGRKSILSEEGIIYARYVNIIFHSLKAAEMEIADQKSTHGTVLISPNAGPSYLPQIVADFHRQYPNIRIQLVKYQLQKHDARTQDPDFYFTVTSPYFHVGGVHGTYSNPGGEFIPLIQEDIYLAVSINHPLASRKSISMKELTDQELIMFPTSSTMRKIIDCVAESAGISLESSIAIECSEWQNLVSLITLGAGIGFVPRSSWGPFDQKKLVLIPIEDPHCSRVISLHWTTHSYISNAANLFRSYITRYFSATEPGQLC